MSDKTIRILLIEDNPGDAYFIREVLSDVMTTDPDGPTFDLEWVDRLSAGLERLAEGDFDVILLDLSLPDNRGIDTFTKTHAQASGVPIVVLSGLGDKELAIQAVQEGAQDYLVKGQVSGSPLMRAIRHAIERKRAEETLRESEEWHRLLLSSITDGCWAFDTEWRYTLVNEAGARLVAMAPDQLLGYKLTELFSGIEQTVFFAAYERSMKERTTESITAPFALPDGRERVYDVQVYPIPDGILCIGRDVTEHERAEGRLKKLNECFVSFGADPAENVNRLTVLCGEMLGATCALYNCLEGGMLCSRGQWNTPRDYNPVDKPDGHICYDVIQRGKDEVFLVRNLSETPYAKTDPNVTPYGLQTYVGWPVKLGDAYVGSLCTVYQEDFVPSEADERFMEIVAAAIGVEEERRQAEEALQHRAEFERLITGISTHFINLAPQEIDSGIDYALEAIGQFAGVDRSYVFRFRDDGATMDNTHEWCAEGVEPQIQRIQEVPLDPFHWSLERIKRLEDVHIPRVADLPPEAGAEKEEFQAEGIQSLVMVPMAYGSTAIGFLGFDSIRAEKMWPEDLVALLRMTGNIFASALERKRTGEALHHSLEKTARGQRLLLALSQAIQDVQRARTPEEVYQTIGDEIAGLGYRATIFTLTDDRAHLVVSHTTIEAALLRAAKKLTGFSARNYHFPLAPDGFYQRVLAEGKTVFSTPDARPVAEALPGPARPLAARLATALGLEQAIHAPLTVGDEPHGLLVVSGAGLTEADVPAVSAFANQAAIAIENAWLYQAAQQEITERKRAEEALREGEERLQLALEAATDGLFDWNMQTGEAYFSPRYYTMLGYEPDEMPASDDTWMALLHPDDKKFTSNTVNEYVEGKRDSHEIEYRMRTKSGEWRWILSRGKATERDASGRPVRMVGTHIDLTERKRAEEALQDSRHMLQTVLDSIPAAVFWKDRDSLYLGGNRTWLEAAGQGASEEVVGKSDYDLPWEKEQADSFREDDREVIESGIPKYDIIEPYRRADGTHAWAKTNKVPLQDTEGNVIGVLGTYEDITERKQAEVALRESEATMRSIFRAAPVGIGMISERVILQANNRFCEMTGYSREEILGQNARLFYPTDEEYERVGREKYAQIREHGTGTVETRFQCKDGTRIDILLSSTPIDPSDPTAGVTFTALDITERKQAETAVRKSQESLARAQAIAHLGGWEWNMVTQETTWSEENFRIYGYEPGDFEPTFEKFIEIVHPDDQDMIMQKLGDIQAGKIAEDTYEYRIILPDGTERRLEGQLGVMFGDDGQPVALAGTNLDITERKQAEEALRGSKQLLERTLDSLRDAVFVIDANTVEVLDCNPAASEVFGYSSEEMLGRTTAFLHVDEVALKEFRELLFPAVEKEGFLFLPEFRMKRKDGTVFPTEHSVTPLEDESGKRFGWVSVVRDITERKQAEEERGRLLAQVQEQAQRVQQIMDTVPEGVFLLDTTHRVIMANPIGEKDLAALAGAEVRDTLTHLGGRPLEELLTSPPKGLWHELATDGRSFQVIARPIENGPEPKGWVLVVRDVTQQREIERRIQQQERLAAVGQLAAGIAHDFNNIMAVITLYADMSLRTPDLPPKVYERLEIIDQQAHRASELIQQLMDFSRRAVLERGPMDLVVFLKEQVKLLQRTLPENIRVNLTYGKDEYTVNADPTRIQQAIMNLATNARDAMPDGGSLRLGLDRIRIDNPKAVPLPDMKIGEWIRVTAADTGTGIPPDVLPHIYDPFFTTKPPGKGAGLGLSQVYGIIRQHEGSVDVDTEVGRGTTFILYLPALTLQQPETSTPREQPLPQGQGQTILVVEDNAATREAVVGSLDLLGYRALEAANGQEALAIFEQHARQIALVLSDIVMPEMGGQALFQALRQQEPGVKVVLMTGHPLEEKELEPSRAQGLSGWLPKPPTLEQLARVVMQALEES